MNRLERSVLQMVPTCLAMTATMFVTFPMFKNSVGLLTTILAAFLVYFSVCYLSERLVDLFVGRNSRLSSRHSLP